MCEISGWFDVEAEPVDVLLPSGQKVRFVLSRKPDWWALCVFHRMAEVGSAGAVGDMPRDKWNHLLMEVAGCIDSVLCLPSIANVNAVPEEATINGVRWSELSPQAQATFIGRNYQSVGIVLWLALSTCVDETQFGTWLNGPTGGPLSVPPLRERTQ